MSNIGIFAQKAQGFNRPPSPLHSQDHTPSPCANCYYHMIHKGHMHSGSLRVAHAILNTAGLHTRKWRAHNLVTNMAPGTNYHRSVSSHLGEFLYYTHSEKMTVSIISQWEFIFNMTFPLPHMNEASWIGNTSKYRPLIQSISSIPLYLPDWVTLTTNLCRTLLTSFLATTSRV